MKPYYEHGGITIYHGDCREILGLLPAHSVDLVVSDPPYGMSWRSNQRRVAMPVIVGDDGSLDVADAVRQMLRVVREGRHLYLFGSYDLSSLPVSCPVELIWDKGQMSGGDVSQPWGRSDERIMFCVSQIRQPKRTRGGETLSARLRKGSVVRCQRLNSVQVNRHPTEKPVSILRQLIESSSVMGETVCDPFAGVGSTLVAAALEGRKAIGIEIEESYCEIAAKRLQQEVLPLETTA